nr:MAG TPA: hypothetical protein [Caudoviricetes sp.]
MPQNKKFIVTKDELVSNTLLANGFHLVSNISGIYTFINDDKIKYNFEEIDIKKLAYTDRLVF